MIKSIKAPEGAMLSDTYTVYVKSVGTDYQQLSVYTALTSDGTGNSQHFPPEFFKEFDGLEYGTRVTKTYFSSFDTDEDAEVKIVYNGNAGNFKIKPETLNKRFRQDGNSVAFTISPGEKLVIEAGGNIFNSLKLFCNEISVPENSKDNYIEFKPGYYTSKNCDYISINEHGVPVIDGIPDNTTVYIHDGAVLCAAVVLKNKHNIKICGRGIISLIERCYGADRNFSAAPLYGGFRYWALPNIYIQSGISNIDIEGICLNCEFRGIVIRNSENINISNVKMISGCVNADGINVMNTRRLLIENCFIQSADDCIAVFTSCDSIPALSDSGYSVSVPVSSDIEAKGCTLFTIARPFMVGGHATGNTNPHDLVENISFHDIEVVDIANNIYKASVEHVRYWSGVFRILSQSEQYVRNISFKNININWTRGYIGKAVHIEVRSDETASYTEKQGYRIENISFENIHFYNCPASIMESVIISDFKGNKPNSDYGISKVTFKNFTYDKKPIEYSQDYIITDDSASDINVFK